MAEAVLRAHPESSFAIGVATVVYSGRGLVDGAESLSHPVNIYNGLVDQTSQVMSRSMDAGDSTAKSVLQGVGYAGSKLLGPQSIYEGIGGIDTASARTIRDPAERFARTTTGFAQLGGIVTLSVHSYCVTQSGALVRTGSAGGRASLEANRGAETFYRSMSQAHYDQWPKNQTPIFQGRRGRPCREAMIRASRRVSRLKPEPLPVRATATSACGPPRTTPGPVGGRADLRRGLDPQGRRQPLRRPARRRPGQRQLQVTGGKRHDYTQHQVVLVPCEGVSPDAMDCRVIARRRPRSPRRVGRYCRGRRAPFALVQPTVRRTPGMLACGFTQGCLRA